MKLESSSMSTGFFLISSVFIMVAVLATGDVQFLVFFVPLGYAFGIASSKDRGSVSNNLSAIGWTDKNLHQSILYGIGGGILGVILGSILLTTIPATIVPDFSFMSKVVSATVVPAGAVIFINVISQWFIVSTSEETLSKILAPQGFVSIVKNVPLAFILSGLLWIGMHYPTYTMQGASPSMYIVLGLLYMITLGLFYATGNILSSVIAHGTFNTIVIVSNTPSPPAVLASVMVLVFLGYMWIQSSGRNT